MTKYICRAWAPAVVLTLLVAGCSGGEKSSDTLGQDTTLNRDLQMANRDSTSQPQLTDVPHGAAGTPRSGARLAPSHTTPRSTPTSRTTPSGNTVTQTPGARETALGTIPAGATLDLASASRICTNTNHVGDHVTATVREAVAGSNGAVIPAGATATLEITSLKRSENVNDKIQMGFRALSVSFGGHSYPVDGTVSYAQVDKVKNQPTGKDVQKVATGAAIGAVLGKIFGKSTKATVIGGAAGAAAGVGAAAATANYEGCVPAGGRITVSLNSAMQVHT